MKLLNLFYTFIFVLFGTYLSAQVTSVNYQMKYDTAECRYDCYIIINAGSATTSSQRIQFNSQYTIVVPAGDTLVVDTSYFPLEGNEVSGTGTVPVSWAMSTYLNAPNAQPGDDFYSIVPPITPTARYDNLSSGDTVKVFSVTVSNIADCSSGIRIWENGTDPSSSVLLAAGDPGVDFDNGFTMGSGIQKYNDNSTQLYPPKPVIVSADNTCTAGIEIDLTATTSSCQTPLTYAWTGPNGFTSTSEDVSIFPAGPAEEGTYTVVVTGAFGCQDSLDVVVTAKPDAGADIEMCADLDTVVTASPVGGTWHMDGGNPTGATMTSLLAGKANIVFDETASGTYSFRYELGGCSDTMDIVVNPLPVVAITGSDNLCVFETTTLSPNSGGTWVSNNPAIATVDANTGVVTAISNGTATFTFTDALTGCKNTTDPVTINEQPAVTNSGPSDTLCIDGTTQLTPTAGGTWASSDALVASVTNAGVVTALTAGIAGMVFTETATGCVSDTIKITVTAKPIVTVADNEICVFGTTSLTPNSGGTWVSSNTLVATVTHAGEVTGVASGTVTFTFTYTSSGCVSDPTEVVTVLDGPVVSITGNNPICIGATSTLSPNSGGIWVSSDPLVASVVAATGVVTGVAQGTVTFTFTNGSTGCTNTTGFLTVDPAPTLSSDASTICIGLTATLSPASTLGTWTNLTPLLASLTDNIVTGDASGTAQFEFVDNTTGCKDTIDITIEAGPVVAITGIDSICAGFTTNLSPTTGGFWTSSDANIATVAADGTVTGVNEGTATFIFQDATTGCKSDPTDTIWVIARPIIVITGPDELCIGETSSITPATGGTWVSDNDAIATIDNAGIVTAVSAGSTFFTFTDATTGCVSQQSGLITVNEITVSGFSGPDEFCAGFTTQLYPISGGTWASSDTSIAEVTNAGLVTGKTAGSVDFTFTNTATTCVSIDITATILARTDVSITGDDRLCIGETSTLSPTVGGSWASSDTDIATVAADGTVTAIAEGVAFFTFTDATTGCESLPTDGITVDPTPLVNIDGGDEICIGSTTSLSPATGGTWVSGDVSIATVDVNTGVVTAVAEGTVKFIFTDTASGCVSDSTADVTILPVPETVLADANICVGQTTSITPSVGGSWISSDPAIATITSGGIITAVAPGQVGFTFTDTNTGCSSAVSDSLTVDPGPTIVITGADELCIGETTTLTPTTGGTWVSSDNAIATITNGGIVTAIGAGLAYFTFTETSSGCSSIQSDAVTVHPTPTVSVNGPTTICVGGTTNLLPNSGGTWVSSDPAIATVDNTGLVTGVAVGSVSFTFTDSTTGCDSDPSDAVISIAPSPTATITGLTDICLGEQTTLSPASGGIWTSSDLTVATVNNEGIVTSVAPGIVSFTFQETSTGCNSEASTGDLTISNCINPDFNATFVDITVLGDVNTNDDTPVGTLYGAIYQTKSTPGGSVYTLVINSNGTYNFVGNTVGVYVYEVPVCIPPTLSGCQTSTLTITVVDYLEPDNRPIANTDIATTPLDTPVTLGSLDNDRCVVANNCNLDATSVTITVVPNNGIAVASGVNGDITYTPDAGFTGRDTLTYQVCVDLEPGNCATAIQIITINSSSALNSTVAADDFATTQQETPVSGNVMDNDSDPEGDLQTITAQTTTVAAGTLVLGIDGAYTFTPATLFYGPVDFPYHTCDDNATQACTDATLHILVVRDLTIRIRVYLEGALLSNGGAIGTTHTRPLMRDNLRQSTFTGATYIPTKDPYKYADTYVDVTSKYDHVGPGNMSRFDSIVNPTTVFAVTGEDAIVDWVYVELRDKTTNTTVLASRQALVQRDGDIVDTDGVNGLQLPGVDIDDYYIAVRHRNHLGSMTSTAQTPQQLADIVDFTLESTGIFDFGTTENVYDYAGLAQNANIKPGYLALWAGDFDGSKKIKFDNPNDDLNTLFFNVLLYPTNPAGNSNFDFAYGYLSGDYDMNGKAKYDNPNDDKNLIYGQLLFYPLNSGFLSNFDFFIEQVPNQ